MAEVHPLLLYDQQQLALPLHLRLEEPFVGLASTQDA